MAPVPILYPELFRPQAPFRHLLQHAALTGCG